MRIPQSQMVDSRWGAVYYAQAWSVIYFIIHGDEGRREAGLALLRPYKELLKTYFQLLRQGKNLHEAYRMTFQNQDMDAFDREWRKFIGALEAPEEPPSKETPTPRTPPARSKRRAP